MSNIKKIVLLWILCLGTTGLQAQTMDNQEEVHKVIFQMTSGDVAEQKALMNNLRNLKTHWGDKTMIHVVVHGPGIEMVMKEKSKVMKEIGEMTQSGVVFQACENTLKQKHISKAEIMKEVGFVPSGLVEIITKQEQGWIYIKSNF